MDDLRRHQLIAAEALMILKNICEENGIRYYLLAGTCLGAVRHQGFIPWDDDIDVGVLNEDYDYLDKLLSKKISSPYTWISNNTNEKYPRLFGKILYDGIACVDVFKIVHLPKDRKKINVIWNTRRILCKLYARKCALAFENESQIYYWCSSILALLISKKKIVQLCRENEARCIGEGDYLNIYSIYGLEKETIKKELIESQSVVQFEENSYTTVSDTDAYLTHLYGDYMTPPPDAQKKLRHINVIFGEEDAK